VIVVFSNSALQKLVRAVVTAIVMAFIMFPRQSLRVIIGAVLVITVLFLVFDSPMDDDPPAIG